MATLVSLAPAIAICIVWLATVLYLRPHGGAGWAPLVLWTVFFVYLYKVLDLTLLQYQSLLVLKLLQPGIVVRGMEESESLNLVPLAGLSAADAMTSLLNILLMVPFGVGLPVVTRLRIAGVVSIAAAFSLAIEVLQFATGQLAGTTFRVADVNDVIFNAAGAVLGYGIFVLAVKVARRAAAGGAANPLLLHIATRPQIGHDDVAVRQGGGRG